MVADEVRLRINLKAGGSDDFVTRGRDWLLRPASNVAAPLAIDRDVYDIKLIPLEAAATASFRASRSIGAGDDAFITGLLIHHSGESRNMPIVRLGGIAALPPDPVWVDIGNNRSPSREDVVALIEIRSFGGLSGSPVFVYLPFWRVTEKGDLFVGMRGNASSGGKYRLLV